MSWRRQVSGSSGGRPPERADWAKGSYARGTVVRPVVEIGDFLPVGTGKSSVWQQVQLAYRIEQAVSDLATDGGSLLVGLANGYPAAPASFRPPPSSDEAAALVLCLNAFARSLSAKRSAPATPERQLIRDSFVPRGSIRECPDDDHLGLWAVGRQALRRLSDPWQGDLVLPDPSHAGIDLSKIGGRMPHGATAELLRQAEQLVAGLLGYARRLRRNLLNELLSELTVTFPASGSPPLTRLIAQFRTALVGALTRTAPPLAA